MTDQRFLWWLHERLVNVYAESDMMDYMNRLRAIIVDMPPEKETVSISNMDTDVETLRQQFKY